MKNINLIAAKTFINLLPDAQKLELLKSIKAGVEVNKIGKKQRVKDYIKWLDKK